MVKALTYHNTQFIMTVKSCLEQGQVAEAPANVVCRQMSFENVSKNVFFCQNKYCLLRNEKGYSIWSALSMALAYKASLSLTYTWACIIKLFTAVIYGLS